MVDGIENKEPNSPRIKNGEFIDEECKFLPPPKSVGHPRLFFVKADRAIEYSNKQQMEYRLRCFTKDEEIRKVHSEVRIEHEPAELDAFIK